MRGEIEILGGGEVEKGWDGGVLFRVSAEERQGRRGRRGCARLTVLQVRGRSLGRVQPASAAAMFGVVVDEHVVGDGQYMTIHTHRGRHHHLRGGN